MNANEMNANPHNLQFPTVPVIPVRAFMEIQAILAELPDDAERGEVEEAQMQVDVAAAYGRFDVERNPPSKQGALLDELVNWLMANEPNALADFIGQRYPQTVLPD